MILCWKKIPGCKNTVDARRLKAKPKAKQRGLVEGETRGRAKGKAEGGNHRYSPEHRDGGADTLSRFVRSGYGAPGANARSYYVAACTDRDERGAK